MAADAHHHRQGGRDEQGYDGRMLLIYRVVPARRRFSARQVLTGRFADGRLDLGQQTGQPSRAT